MEYVYYNDDIKFSYGYIDGSKEIDGKKLVDAIIDAGTLMDKQDISRDNRYVKLNVDQINALHGHFNKKYFQYRGTNESIRQLEDKEIIVGYINGMKIIKVSE